MPLLSPTPWTRSRKYYGKPEFFRNLLVAKAVERFGRIDVLITCAGIVENALSWKLSAESWDRVLAVNLKGPFLCAKHVIPLMRKQEYGRIINISSVVAQAGVAGTASYAASKGGLDALTRTLAQELITKNITVNSIVSGYLNTGIISAIPPDICEKIIQTIPAKRLGTPKEVCHLIETLCHPDAAYITGQNINIDGGFRM